MRILLSNLTYGTAFHSRTYRPHLLTQEWAKMGHEVRFLGGSYNHLFVNIPPPTDVELKIDEDGVDYRLLPVPHYKGNGIGRAKSVLQIWKLGEQAILRHAREFKPDLIIAATVYQTDNWGVIKAAREHGAVALRETRDLWPLTAREFIPMANVNPLIHLIQKAEDFGCQNMDAVISTLPDAILHLETRGLKRENFYHSHQVAVDIDASVPLEPEFEAKLRALRPGAKVLAALPCTFAASQHVDVLIRAIHQAGPGYRLALIGNGQMEEELRALVSELKADVHFLGSIPRAMIPAAMKLVDVGLCYFEKPFLKYGVSPNKVTDFLASGLPAILASPAAKNIVQESGGGFSLHNGKTEDIASALHRFAELSEAERAEMGRLGREFVANTCTPRHIAQQYLDIAARYKK